MPHKDFQGIVPVESDPCAIRREYDERGEKHGIQYGNRIQVLVQEENRRNNEEVSGPSCRNVPPAHILITAVAARDP